MFSLAATGGPLNLRTEAPALSIVLYTHIPPHTSTINTVSLKYYC